MDEGSQRVHGRLAAALVETSSRHPWAVVLLCALLTAGSIYAAATILELDGSSFRTEHAKAKGALSTKPISSELEGA